MSALALLASAACDCGDPLGQIPLNGRLSGVICDEATGLPASGRDLRYEHDEVSVTRSATTDEWGAFVLEDVPLGEGRVVVSQGGLARRIPVSLEEEDGEAPSLVVVDPSCRPGPQPGGLGGIEGHICDRHVGDYLKSASVRVVLPDDSVLETATDDDGYFSLEEVPSGPRLVQVTTPGFSRTFLVDVYDGEITTMGEGEVCERGEGSEGYIVGDLCDPTWQGQLAGADVRAVDADGRVHTDVTDVDGYFALGPMSPGTVQVEVERAPDVSWELEASVVAGQDVVVTSPAACAGGDPGGVRGRLCAPNGNFWLTDATVWVDVDGTRYETFTDADGRYLLQGVPPGEHTVYVKKGSFTASFFVEIVSGEITEVPETECEIVVEQTRIAVVEGSYDHMGEVLIDIGIDPGMIDTFGGSWASQLFGDPSALSDYDIIIINCGAPEADFFANASTYIPALRQFVEDGGSLYASDWAYDIVEQMFPSALEFHGDDLLVDAAQVASNTGNASATVTDVALAQALGQSSLTVKLWAPWAILLDTRSDVRVYVRGLAQTGGESFTDAPYTVGFPVGEGRVLFTAWHQEPGINVEAERLLQLLVFEL